MTLGVVITFHVHVASTEQLIALPIYVYYRVLIYYIYRSGERELDKTLDLVLIYLFDKVLL